MPSLERVRRMTADILSVDPAKITAQSGPADLSEWDSVQHLNLMLEVENTFGVSLSPDEMASVHSVGELADLVDRLTAK